MGVSALTILTGIALHLVKDQLSATFIEPEKLGKIEPTETMNNIAKAIGLEKTPKTYIVKEVVNPQYIVQF